MFKKSEKPIVELAQVQWVNERPKEFDALQFKTALLTPPIEPYKGFIPKNAYAFEEVEIDSETYQLAGRWTSFGDDGNQRNEYAFCLGKGEGMVALNIDLLPYTVRQCAKTDVERDDVKNFLKPGFGVNFYKTIFPFLQYLANNRNQFVDHLVEVDARPTATLSPKQWEEKFLPILTEQGYICETPFYYEKTYTPESMVKE